MGQETLEQELRQFPILQYAFLKSDQVIFSQRVRVICKNECQRYGTSWSCPPAVGTVQECKEKCRAFSSTFVFTTVSEVSEFPDFEAAMSLRAEHEDITRKVTDIFRKYYGDILTLSTESCSICEKCTYPDEPCRFPDKMFPCVESYGILVPELAAAGDMEFDNGAGTVTWFSVLFYTL